MNSYWLATIEKKNNQLTALSVFGVADKEEIEEFSDSWDVIVVANDWRQAGEKAFEALKEHLSVA